MKRKADVDSHVGEYPQREAGRKAKANRFSASPHLQGQCQGAIPDHRLEDTSYSLGCPKAYKQ